MEDPDLWPVIAGALPDELAVLARILQEQGVGFTPPPELRTPEARRQLHDAALAAGGHSLINLFRKTGPSWAKIVDAVARTYKLKDKDASLEQREQQITTRSVVWLLKHLSPSERESIELEFLDDLDDARRRELEALAEREGDPDDQDFIVIAHVLLERGPPQDAGQFDPAHKRLVRRLAARNARRKGAIVLLKLLGVGGGPIGNAIFLTVTALQAAGPAYRLMIPAVVWTCIVRTRLAVEALEDGAFGSSTTSP
ncbi:MAG: hypothetical protein R3A51_04660 [Nannocystaceae bacterium]